MSTCLSTILSTNGEWPFLTVPGSSTHKKLANLVPKEVERLEGGPSCIALGPRNRNPGAKTPKLRIWPSIQGEEMSLDKHSFGDGADHELDCTMQLSDLSQIDDGLARA